jgi:hypothetical protein
VIDHGVASGRCCCTGKQRRGESFDAIQHLANLIRHRGWGSGNFDPQGFTFWTFVFLEKAAPHLASAFVRMSVLARRRGSEVPLLLVIPESRFCGDGRR